MEKIIWAVNAFEDIDSRANVLPLLGALTRSLRIKIEPVFILHPGSSDFRLGLFEQKQADLLTLAEKKLRGLTLHTELDLDPPVVLISYETSARRNIHVLLEHAKVSEADAIVVATHARRGLKQWVLGSFTETLILLSSTPVITVNPETKIHERISKILFPTDFAGRYHKSFKKAVQLAKALDANLILFYKEPYIEADYMSPMVLHDFENEKRTIHERGELWRKEALALGIKTEMVIDGEPGSVALAIHQLSEDQKIDLIVMASEADRLSTILIGSTTRQVVRLAHCPVWTMRYG